jgi:hypothetical protein
VPSAGSSCKSQGSNTQRSIIRALKKLGGEVEAASMNELRMLLKLSTVSNKDLKANLQALNKSGQVRVTTACSMGGLIYIKLLS